MDSNLILYFNNMTCKIFRPNWTTYGKTKTTIESNVTCSLRSTYGIGSLCYTQTMLCHYKWYNEDNDVLMLLFIMLKIIKCQSFIKHDMDSCFIHVNNGSRCDVILQKDISQQTDCFIDALNNTCGVLHSIIGTHAHKHCCIRK